MQSFSELVSPRLDLGDDIIGMRDLQSNGRLYEIEPIPSEAADQQHILKTHESIVEAICELMPERRMDPWIMQFFIYDEPHLAHFSKRVHDYRNTHGEKNSYSDNWLRTLYAHLSDASAERGMFRDDQQAPWRARKRRLRLCVWRRTQPGESHNPTDNLKYVTERVETVLAQARLRLTKLSADGSLRMADSVVCAKPQWRYHRRGIRSWPAPTSPARRYKAQPRNRRRTAFGGLQKDRPGSSRSTSQC